MIDQIYQERLTQAKQRIKSATTEELATDGFSMTVAKECMPVIPEIVLEKRKGDYKEEAATPGTWAAAGGGMMGQGNVVTKFEFTFPIRHQKSSEYALMMTGLGIPDKGRYKISEGHMTYEVYEKGSAKPENNIADVAREDAITKMTGLNRMFSGFQEPFMKFFRSELLPFVSTEVTAELKRRIDDDGIRSRL